MTQPPWTINRLLSWTEDFLKKKGRAEGAKLESQILLAHVMNCKRTDLFIRYDEIADEAVRQQFRELIKRRVDGCPVAYLVGKREFYLLPLTVTPAVLIPRPETEILVIEALSKLKSKATPKVCDVGTGSGCIPLAIAARHTGAIITAIDISPEALEVARSNAEMLKFSPRISFLQGDLLDPVGEASFDLITSNPPYVTSSEYDCLMVDVKNYEPKLALEAGPDGLDVYRRLIPQAANHLEPGGTLLLEIGPTVQAGVVELIGREPLLEGMIMIEDGQRLPRVVMTTRKR